MRHLDSDGLAAIAEVGSFAAAAQRLNKSQAAVSIAIGRLEERLGKKLFDRLPRRVALTSAGERLHHDAQRILALDDEPIALLSDATQEARVRLGMPDDYMALFGGALVDAFAARYPLVGIDLRCSFSWQLETMVETRELDMAIIT